MKFEEAYSLWKAQGGFLCNELSAVKAVVPEVTEPGTKKRRFARTASKFTKWTKTSGGEWLKIHSNVVPSKIQFALSSIMIDDWDVVSELKPTPNDNP